MKRKKKESKFVLRNAETGVQGTQTALTKPTVAKVVACLNALPLGDFLTTYQVVERTGVSRQAFYMRTLEAPLMNMRIPSGTGRAFYYVSEETMAAFKAEAEKEAK